MSDDGPVLDVLDEENTLRTIAVTLMQIRDYLAVTLAKDNPNGANLLEEIHSQGKIFLQPPVLLDSTISVKHKEEDGTNE